MKCVGGENMKLSEYQNLSKKFLHKSKDYTKQFAHIYTVRLCAMRNRLCKKVSTLYNNQIPVKQLADLSENEKCFVIGTIYKHQDLKPSILKELSEEYQLMSLKPNEIFASEKDELILEDELQRIRLTGNIDVPHLVTGVVCAVLGKEGDDGKFVVEEMFFPDIPSCTIPCKTLSISKYVIFLSDLSLANSENRECLEMLSDWLAGVTEDSSSLNSKIERCVIAGNTYCSPRNDKLKLKSNDQLEVLNSINFSNNVLSALSSSVNVDIMPGVRDPTNYMLPQQPIHFCLLPSNSACLQAVTNPYEFVLCGKKILGTSGQPINDIRCCTTLSDPLNILELTLHWSHLAPTCPDTLSCYPYMTDDPFVISEAPDVYFCGNQPSFQTQLVDLNGQKVRLICIPSFDKVKSVVLLDLFSLNCFTVSFEVLINSNP